VNFSSPIIRNCNIKELEDNLGAAELRLTEENVFTLKKTTDSQ
jgi:hypothetical protein